jgi:hypothetical protein
MILTTLKSSTSKTLVTGRAHLLPSPDEGKPSECKTRTAQNTPESSIVIYRHAAPAGSVMRVTMHAATSCALVNLGHSLVLCIDTS